MMWNPFTGLFQMRDRRPSQVSTGGAGSQSVSSSGILTLTSTEGTVDITGSGTSRNLHVPGAVVHVGTNTWVYADAPTTITIGDSNTLYGLNAGVSLTEGSNNTFFGYNAGNLVTTGNQNTLIGISAGEAITTGGSNTCVGSGAGVGIVDGNANFAMAKGSLGANTSGEFNTALGVESLASVTSGSNNVGIGAQTILSGGSVNNCIAIGQGAMGGSNSTISYIIAIGDNLGSTIDTNSNIILLGKSTEPSSSSSTNEMAIGSESGPITRYWLGNGGASASSPSAITISPSIAGGTNIPGANFIVEAGNGTGTGGSGVYRIRTAPAGSSGTTPNTMADHIDFDLNGNIRAYRLHNNATSQGNSGNQDIRSGTYTPTVFNITNLDTTAVTTQAQWSRVGNVVTVAGRFTADPTTLAITSDFELSLPVPSNLGAVEDLAGIAFCGNIAGMGAEVVGVVANDRAKVQWKVSDVTSQDWSYIYAYEVI